MSFDHTRLCTFRFHINRPATVGQSKTRTKVEYRMPSSTAGKRRNDKNVSFYTPLGISYMMYATLTFSWKLSWRLPWHRTKTWFYTECGLALSGRSAAAARRRAKCSHFLLLWLPGSPCTQWTKLRGRRCLSTRERTSFVAVPHTENGRVLPWRADNLPSFAFFQVCQTFEQLFHRAFHDWTLSG